MLFENDDEVIVVLTFVMASAFRFIMSLLRGGSEEKGFVFLLSLRTFASSAKKAGNSEAFATEAFATSSWSLTASLML